MATASMKTCPCPGQTTPPSTLLFVFIIIVASVSQSFGDDCTIQGYDVKMLSKYNPWMSSSFDGNITYKISLCEPVTVSNAANECPQKTSVCQLTKGKQAISIGNYTTTFNATKNSNDGEVLAFFRGESCPSMPTEYRTTVIYFKCGKTLGSPVFLGAFECSTYFEWESHVFCEDVQKPVEEVPCYLYLKNEKYDLSPLAKTTGAYLVDSTENRQFYINVCRDITGAGSDPSSKCPVGSSACRIVDGKAEDMGKPSGSLQRSVDGNLLLQYQTTVKPDGCVDNPTTTITFVCPTRGGSKDPLLIDDRLCHNQIEWKTEYACPESTLTSDTCVLTQENHNIDIDLTPLKNPPAAAHPYKMNVTDGTDHYVYVLNVCDSLGLECPDKKDSASACQFKEHDSTFAKNLGKKDTMKLRMTDGELTLTYKDGTACHTKFRRNTIITFKCNMTAGNNGRGWPVFREANNCTYLFDWETKYACENHLAVGACRVDHNQQRYDLSALVRNSGSNWVALDGENQYEQSRYFINVCNDILNSTSGCTANSICRKDAKGNTKKLGRFTQSPTYDPSSKTLQIKYTGGDNCQPGKSTSSRITFICKPGDLESGPVLIQETDDKCMYEFEWHTAAACVLSKKKGSNCKVFDDDAGYSFDVSRLTKPAGKYYKVSDSKQEYDFLLNVCGPVTGTKCDVGHTNTAVCQVKKSDDSIYHKTGEPNSNLEYFDGMINLTYTNGDSYNNAGHTPRQTEIAFLCDSTKGAGTPEFVSETNYTYSFKWYTAYACPAQPIECVYQDKVNSKQYDLSRLSMSETKDNWMVVGDNTDTSRRVYINVCRPVNPVHVDSGQSCGPFAAACETQVKDGKETVVHSSLGEARAGPTSDGDHPGQLMLRYTGGDQCVDQNGHNTTMTMVIHFSCDKGKLTGAPLPFRKLGPCEYSTIWRTAAACPIDDVETDTSTCSIKDPNSDFIYNLKPLMKKGEDFYKVTADKRTFLLNVCGNVSSCDRLQPDNVKASVCEEQTTRKPALAMSSGSLEFSDDGQLMLTYGGKRLINEQQVQVKISFVCRRDASDKPTFVRQEDNTYYFKFETALACPPQPVDCLAIDEHGNEYDLTALAKTTSNWVVSDTRAGYSKLKYYLNVCRPMTPIAGSSCPGGPIGGCQTGDRAFSLGYVQSKPVVTEDGSLVLEYRGGTLCHKGTDRESHRSTRINFICSRAESDPVFMGETETCEYLFEWNTPSACPQHKITGKDCKVTDPVYNYQFDLSHLHKTREDYKVKAGEYTYLLNVCGQLTSGTGACAGVGTCQTKESDNSFIVNAGKANSDLIYNAGELSLRYTDGKANCHQKYNRTTIITFTCDHTKDGKKGPRYLREDGDCTYQFEWPTSYACSPHKVSDCTATDPDGNVYDLSSLTRPNDNYIVDKSYKQLKFILNVCQTLVYKKDQTCPPNSAACMVNLTETQQEKKFHKIGELTDKPVKFDTLSKTLIIQYENGEKCPVANQSVSTIIILTCDLNAYDSEPSDHFLANLCQHRFVWKTRAACSVEAREKSAKGGNCTAINPDSGYTFDLSALKKSTGYRFDDGNNHDFRINVCAPVTGSGCDSNVGSCQKELVGEKRSFSAGIANSNLQFRGGFLMLNYSGGALCHGKYQRSTIINFICGHGKGDGYPILVDETDDCVYHFNWHTSRVCEKEVECSVETQGPSGSYKVDLSPLIKASGHHVAIAMTPGANSGTTYYINICRPLNPIQGKLCPPGSAACRVEGDKPPLSLGHLAKGPYVDSVNGKVTLAYVNGSKCTKDPSRNITTHIIFTCKAGSSQGEPKFELVADDCDYVFMWYTNLACEDNQISAETSSCTYNDPSTGQRYDISALNTPVPVYPAQGGSFYIQPCGAINKPQYPGCAGSSSCHVDHNTGMSYGDARKGMFMMESREILKLLLTGGSQCVVGGMKVQAKTEILFQCDYSAGNGKPQSWPSAKCSAVFVWKTNLICPPIIEDCSLVHDGTVYDFGILSRDTGSWNYTDSKKNIYFLNICQGVHGQARGEGCHMDSAVCRKTADKRTDMLGAVRTQQLYMDADGKTIVLEYSQGASACSHSRRRSNNPMAKTIIKFKCDKLVGGPRYIESARNTEDCIFEFEWKTRLACKKDTLMEAVQDNNGIIIDPRSSGMVDIKKLSATHRDHIAHEMSKDNYTYSISLEGKLEGTSTGACAGAAVCQRKPLDSNVNNNLGTFTSRKYYFKDDQLEVVYTSPDKCVGRDGHRLDKNVSSAIVFNCDMLKNKSEPTLTYKSRNCFYLFEWDTDAVCFSAVVDIQHPAVYGAVNEGTASNGGKSSGVKPKTVGVIISVFLSVIVICIILIVFHKPERRAAFASRVKRTCRCHTRTERHIKYSMLTQDDEDPEVDEDFFMDHDNDITTLPNTSTDTTIQTTTAQVRSYHDDSDDDLLE
ncbi:cation-independent mannose-6-phosphate receptor-like isoform X2 [Haliotis asinina]|uniref:cation-independent mannose-6-phosphate receptor-like isoform X2 n=1 Tax=Haliotis asinina TaxID=109174 RepID=UPI003531C22D